MASPISYIPDTGVILNGISLEWDTDRKTVRSRLDNSHKSSDYFISEINMYQRRDIYNNYGAQGNSFFLNYNESNNLSEIEIHWGFKITIKNIIFLFGENIFEIVAALKKISATSKILKEGEYFFTDLKLTISDAESMGGDGNGLSYFYCAKNIDHLLK